MDISKEKMTEYKIGTDFIFDKKHYTITNWCKYYKVQTSKEILQFDICLTLKDCEGNILLYGFNLTDDNKYYMSL